MYKAKKQQIWSTTVKAFFWKDNTDLETFKQRYIYIKVSYKLVLNLTKAWIESSEPYNVGRKPYNATFCQNNIFWEKETNLGTMQKYSPYIGVSYKFVLKSVKSLNRIFWAMEYWFKVLQCQIWSTHTKPFFWESEAKFETLQKLSVYIGVSYEFALKSFEGLNGFFWVIENWFKALECQIWWRNIKPFF